MRRRLRWPRQWQGYFGEFQIGIAEAFAAIQVEVERSEVRMPDGPIHELGEFSIGIHLHSAVNADVLVRVVPAE